MTIGDDNKISYLERELETQQSLNKLYLKERIEMFAGVLSKITNGEWEELKKRDPELFRFIKQAVNHEST